MDLLPPSNTRPALLDALALIISRSGFETFLRAPLLLPNATYFPEPWEASERGVRLLSLRLLAYAGLDDLDARVTVYSNRLEDHATALGEHAVEGAAAWFAGIEEGTCVFGAEAGQLADGDAIVGVMCHEVAHAFRAYQDLVTTSRDIEEQHTDVTTIYLGFGILTLNSAYLSRSAVAPGGVLGGSVLSVSRRGYLSVQAMAYLLAAQVVARNVGRKGRRLVADTLGANQRACFEAACSDLGDDGGALCVRLGLPPPEAWPEEIPFELPELREDAYFVPAGGPERRPFNEGKSVFRVETPRTGRFATIGSVLGTIGLTLMQGYLHLPNPGGALLGCAIGLALGAAFGMRHALFTCSDPRCEVVHPGRSISQCPRCGGTIRATLRSPAERLEAEECIEDGRPLDALERELDAREARSRRRAQMMIGSIVALLGRGAFTVIVPKRTTVAELRGDADLIGSYVRLEGNVVETNGGDGMQDPETGAVFIPFRFSDGTDTMLVFYDPTLAHPQVSTGARLRVSGKYEEIRVSGQAHTRFVARSVD